MKKLTLLILALLIAAPLATPSQNNADRQAVLNYVEGTQDSIDISHFDLLLGDWKHEEGQDTYEEHWQKTSRYSLTCRALSANKGGTVSTEVFRIEKINGTWTLTAETGNSQPTRFYLKVTEKNRLSFERKEDAFPQRFNYTRKEDETLLVWLEGKLNGRETKLEYPMKKLNPKSSK